MNIDINEIKITQASECLSVKRLVEKTGLVIYFHVHN
jgi:hypothetical protein